jgi:hypothetical protein
LFHLWGTLQGRLFRSATPLLDLFQAALRRGERPPNLGRDAENRAVQNYETLQHLQAVKVVDRVASEIDGFLSSSSELNLTQLRSLVKALPEVDPWKVKFILPVPPALYLRGPAFVESLVAYALVAKSAGFKGLAITIDEFEVDLLGLSPQRFQRMKAIVEGLAKVVRGDTSFPPAPLAIFVANVSDDPEIGGVLLNMLINEGGGKRWTLREWSTADFRELGQRIHTLYSAAYGIDAVFDATLAEEVLGIVQAAGESGEMRAFIRRYIADLDRLYGPPG